MIFEYFKLLFSILSCFTRSKRALVLEIASLRQQLLVLNRKNRKPKIENMDRRFWVLMMKFWKDWRSALLFVHPETVLKWHRSLSKKRWALLSRSKRSRGGRPKIDIEIQELILKMAKENRTWGAGRIYGELLKLGFDVSERSVARYMPKYPERRLSWKTFLKNHREEIFAIDLFTVFTGSFKQLYGIVILDHSRRKILQTSATYFPTSEWIIQQICNSFPGECPYKYLILDNDKKFGKAFDKKVKDLFSVKAVHTSFRSPWQNGVCERVIGTLRRDCLDNMIILSDNHLSSVLNEYSQYYNNDRTHRSLSFKTPVVQNSETRSFRSELTSTEVCNGLHHRYKWSLAS